MVTLYGQEEVFRDYVASQKFSSEVKGIVELSREPITNEVRKD